MFLPVEQLCKWWWEGDYWVWPSFGGGYTHKIVLNAPSTVSLIALAETGPKWTYSKVQPCSHFLHTIKR